MPDPRLGFLSKEALADDLWFPSTSLQRAFAHRSLLFVADSSSNYVVRIQEDRVPGNAILRRAKPGRVPDGPLRSTSRDTEDEYEGETITGAPASYSDASRN